MWFGNHHYSHVGDEPTEAQGHTASKWWSPEHSLRSDFRTLPATVMLLCSFLFIIGRCICFPKRRRVENVIRKASSGVPSFREEVWHQNCLFGFLPLSWSSVLLLCWDIPGKELALGIWNSNLRNGTHSLYIVVFYINGTAWSPQQSSEAQREGSVLSSFHGWGNKARSSS